MKIVCKGEMFARVCSFTNQKGISFHLRHKLHLQVTFYVAKQYRKKSLIRPPNILSTFCLMKINFSKADHPY